MIIESEAFKNNVYWFTTLVGKKSNLDILIEELKNIDNIEEIKETTFYQGKMARWGLAWRFKKESEYSIKINSSKY